MRVPTRLKTLSVAVIFSLLIVLAFAGFFAQAPQKSPSPAPEASPSVSPSPTPTRAPSPTPLPGAQNFHQWGSITVFNGLPSDSVRAIAQTPDGVMWFGTDNGLARFDGRRIQKITIGGNHPERVLALRTSSLSGELWIGTSAGAYLYANEHFLPVANTEGKGVTAVLVEGADVFFGTDSGLVLRVVRDGGPASTQPLITTPITGADGSVVAITSLVETRGQILAATAGRGVFVIRDGTANQLPIVPIPAGVNSIAKTDLGDLWLGTDAPKGITGIYMTGGSGGKSQRVAAPTAKVSTLERSYDGLWVGTERYGLFQIEGVKLKKSFTFANTSGGLRSDTIFTIFTDREDVLWIGTNRGVSRYDREGSFQETISDVPNSNFIRVLFRLPNRPLLAGSNRGLFESKVEKWERVPGFQEKSVYAIAENEDGILVGTSSGVFDLRGKLISGGDTRSITNFRKTYAAVVGRGVVDLSSLRQDVVFPDETACSLFAESNRLWIGTNGHGLFSFDGKSVKSEVGPDVLKSGAIWNLNRGVDGSLWIAGQHGIFRLMNGQVERIVDVEDVRDVFADRSDVWAATTTRGLLHVRYDERLGWLKTSIGFEQGLPSEKTFAIAAGQAGLLIATNRGVVTYKPSTVAPKLITTRVLSQRVHELSEIRSTIALDYPQNSLLVEVAGQSSRTFPEEFQYGFVLTDAKGKEIDRRISNDAQYAPADLAPGEYSIESIAFNRDLLASEPLAIRFSVAKAPFPWTATALGVLLAIAVLGLIWAMIEHRRMQQRNRELAAARLDLANEAERERRRIARDLHDQTLADLRKLMMLTDKSTLDKPAFRTEIEAVSSEIRRICEDLSPSVLENVGLIASLEFLLDNTIEKRKFIAESDLEDRIKLPMNVQLQVYRIAQEVLTNIKSHSNADHVEMSVEVNADGKLKLRIDDNGTSFHPDTVSSKGRGIANIKARASLVNAKVAWKEIRGGGNRFAMSIEV